MKYNILRYGNLIVMLAVYAFYANSQTQENYDPLTYYQNKYKIEGNDLHGEVYSVTNLKMTPVYEFGSLVKTQSHAVDSLIFDENGNLYKKYEFDIYSPKVSTYVVRENSVSIDILTGHVKKDSTILYEYDTTGRPSTILFKENDETCGRMVFRYTKNGYKSTYYKKNNDSTTVIREGDKFGYLEVMATMDGQLNAKGKPIKAIIKNPFFGEGTRVYTYNEHGDLLTVKSDGKLGNKLVGTRVKHESGTRYEYVYDEHGNWVERRKYVNGELKKEYIKRNIVYKSPAEILTIKKQEQEAIRIFEQNLQKKGEEYTKDRKTQNIEYLWNNLLYSKRSLYTKLRGEPVKRFEVNNDKYTFEFSDGHLLSDVIFTTKVTDSPGLLSSDMTVALLPIYTDDGPKWYVLKNEKLGEFISKSDTDWVKIYRNKFPVEKNVSDKEIHELWEEELSSQFTQLVNNDKDYVTNELVNAYENGFISPSIADKKQEEESIEKYKIYKEHERRKNLCLLACSACTFNAKGEPEADKIKKIDINETGLSFKTKDNREFSNIKFNPERLVERNGNYENTFLSVDQSLAIVSVRHDMYFIIEFEGDQIKSVNHTNPKDYIKIARSISYIFNNI